MTEKFRKRMYRIIYLWLIIAGVLFTSFLAVLIKEGVQGFREVWYGKTIVIANGIWSLVIVIILFAIIGIRSAKGDYG